MTEPTARQTQIYETVKRLGSQAEACRELGLTAGAVNSGLSLYLRKTGAPHPTPDRVGSPGARRQVMSIRTTAAMLPGRIDELERIVGLQSDLISELLVAARTLDADVRSFLGRQPLILRVAPDHRRKADGGEGGRSEQRRLRGQVG